MLNLMMGNFNFKITFGTRCYTNDQTEYIALKNKYNSSEEVHEKIVQYLQKILVEKPADEKPSNIVDECVCVHRQVVHRDMEDE